MGNDAFNVYVGGGIGDHDFHGVKMFEGVTLVEVKAISLSKSTLLKIESGETGLKRALR
ncbi:hypothetical protein [Metallosphaera hakonensis]|uniref:hypothetical protein n=1 Tax=Metallosphaera hakonensis TaxID=79601 RepID=UPI000B1B23F1|nr:hypothetical protein [Metallosphaera hakonensis]